MVLPLILSAQSAMYPKMIDGQGQICHARHQIGLAIVLHSRAGYHAQDLDNSEQHQILWNALYRQHHLEL